MRGVDEPDVAWGLDMGEGDILPLICCGDRECISGLPVGDTGHEMFLGVCTSLESKKGEVKIVSYEKIRYHIAQGC